MRWEGRSTHVTGFVDAARMWAAADDWQRAAGWSDADFWWAMGGPIRFVFADASPVTADRRRLLGTYDPRRRVLTANCWTYEFGETAGRRNIVHELAHAWDQQSGYQLSRKIARLPGPSASWYAAAGRFEDFAESVAATIYGPEPGYENFAVPDRDGHLTRLEYVQRSFAMYRGAGHAGWRRPGGFRAWLAWRIGQRQSRRTPPGIEQPPP
jgi:hypothetical protein